MTFDEIIITALGYLTSIKEYLVGLAPDYSLLILVGLAFALAFGFRKLIFENKLSKAVLQIIITTIFFGLLYLL